MSVRPADPGLTLPPRLPSTDPGLSLLQGCGLAPTERTVAECWLVGKGGTVFNFFTVLFLFNQVSYPFLVLVLIYRLNELRFQLFLKQWVLSVNLQPRKVISLFFVLLSDEGLVFRSDFLPDLVVLHVVVAFVGSWVVSWHRKTARLLLPLWGGKSVPLSIGFRGAQQLLLLVLNGSIYREEHILYLSLILVHSVKLRNIYSQLLSYCLQPTIFIYGFLLCNLLDNF